MNEISQLEKQDFKVGLIVPTLNAGADWAAWIEALGSQTLQPDRVLIVDSSSADQTAELARAKGYEVCIIAREEFNHGTTREMAAALLSDMDILIYMTQDALLADKSAFRNLVTVFSDPEVDVAYGRQLPHRDALPIGAHARLFNYTEQSEVRTVQDKSRLGIKVAFCSNSFSAYRRRGLVEAGGFPENNIFGEDTYVVSKILLRGKKIAYCAEAKVYHSHDYTVMQDFKRCFDIGVFHAREPWLRKEFGNAEGEGKKFVISEFSFLSKISPFLLISAFVRSAMKYIGYRAGLLEERIPVNIKRKLSMHYKFWGK